MTDIQPLVVTPRPKPGESLKGFILRTCEANGYMSPSVMLQAAGMTPNEAQAVIPPMEKLALLYARDPNEFAAMGYQRNWDDRFNKHVPILQHQLPSCYLGIKRPRICPECILEHGHIEAFWDLQYAIACPVHARMAIDQCPECRSRLNWLRPGLLECKCGCDLSQYRGETLEHGPTLGLLGLLRSKLLGLPMDHELLADRLGFPVGPLDDMDIVTLIGIIGRLEGRVPNCNQRERPYSRQPPIHRVLARSADALAHWPQGFWAYLRSLEPDEDSRKGFGLRKQFESFFGSLFKSGLPANEVAFIREAFVRFGSEEWKQAYVTRKLDRGAGHGTQIVGIHGLAKALGVMPGTARSLVQKGLIQGTEVVANGRSRLLFDLEQALPFKAAEGVSFTVRKAATWLGLPVSVLRILRQGGHYKVRHIANPTAAYHELDLSAFRQELLSICKDHQVTLSEDLMTLGQVMNMKAGDPAIKAEVIVAIMDGRLIPSGRSGNDIGDLVLHRTEAGPFIRQQQTSHSGSITVVEAARYLHCDPVVVKNLYRDGLLDGVKKPRGLYRRAPSKA